MANRNRPYQALTRATQGGQTGTQEPKLTQLVDTQTVGTQGTRTITGPQGTKTITGQESPSGVEFPEIGKDPKPLPYQQRMEDLLTDLPEIGDPTPEMVGRAQDIADLQIDPQRRALDEMKTEARRQDLEAAAARGVGRTGVVDWADQQRQKDFTGQVQDLERMRGQLTSQELSRMEEQAFNQGIMKLEALRGLAQDIVKREDVHWDQAMEFVMFEADEALQWFDRLHLTPWQKAQLDTTWAEIMGEVPEGTTWEDYTP